MINTITKITQQKSIWMLFAGILISLFLLPAFKTNAYWFAIRLEDIIFPIIALLLIFRYKDITFSNYQLIILASTVYIWVTMVVNHRMGAISDYFEIYKMLKYLCFFTFFYIFLTHYPIEKAIQLITWIFAGVMLFNTLHYFNIFDFNKIIEPYYSTEHHLSFFGLNSLGQPATKRMLGTMGNPNNNAILFLFFITIFFPGKEKNLRHEVLFYISVMGLFACQSRTGLIAFACIFIANWIVSKLSYKIILRQFLIIAAIFFVFIITGSSDYFNSMANQGISNSNSVRGRMEIWSQLWQMILQKPVFGHAPFKEFFYNNQLYSENEYILMAWRYGFIGLISYLLILGFPFLKKELHTLLYTNTNARRVFLFVISILIIATTNNPLSEPRILLIVAFMLAIFCSSVSPHHKKAESI